MPGLLNFRVKNCGLTAQGLEGFRVCSSRVCLGLGDAS